MGLQIEDGTGSGTLAQVSDERLRTFAVNVSLTNHISVEDEEQTVFSAIGTATVVSGTVVGLHVINNDSTNLLVIDRIVVQGVGMGGLPVSTAFFSVGYGRTVTSGGTSVTPVNLNRTATKVANVTATASNPNMTGTFVESHRWFVQANGIAFELIPSRTDDIILGRSNTVEVQLSSQTSGTVLTIFKFFMSTPDHMG